MVPVGSAFPIVSCQLARGGADSEPTVVWLRGEHDVSTAAVLSLAIAQAVAHDCGAVVIDLSDARLISADTVGVLIRAREYLRLRSRSLTLRCACPRVRLALETGGLVELLDPDSAEEAEAVRCVSALASWVAVPVAHPVGASLSDLREAGRREVGPRDH
jgi:anti-anti-sigma factor